MASINVIKEKLANLNLTRSRWLSAGGRSAAAVLLCILLATESLCLVEKAAVDMTLAALHPAGRLTAVMPKRTKLQIQTEGLVALLELGTVALHDPDDEDAFLEHLAESRKEIKETRTELLREMQDSEFSDLISYSERDDDQIPLVFQPVEERLSAWPDMQGDASDLYGFGPSAMLAASGLRSLGPDAPEPQTLLVPASTLGATREAGAWHYLSP